ncbi:LysR family transcriptional regulator [Heliobacterium chlorum]|uniref:LysR family transcriptional regulator n=1 Tax=Heliobacterium chlorum TaxID=2698 RepID=A0ABR7T197_HELCL|nr:LysR family transcriptional regulator [Heliobacterium chlorum]
MLDTQLFIFKTVMEKNSISMAAQELHMTQSAVSQQIQNLEAHFNVKLFDRLHRRIMATTAGKVLYPFAVELDQLYTKVNHAMQDLTGEVSGRLRVGASLTIGEYVLPALLVQFRQAYPKVNIAMDVYNSEQITAMVMAGQLDIGFIEGPDPLPGLLVSLPCSGDELVVIAPAGGEQPRDKAISLVELLQARWVLREPLSGTRRSFEQFLEVHGHSRATLDVVMELGSTQAVKEAVKAGLGISVISKLAVTDEVCRGDLELLPVREGPILRSFTMFYHKEKFTTLAVDRFLAFVAEKLLPPSALHPARLQAEEDDEPSSEETE